MARTADDFLTDEEVESEISRLTGSKAVKLARKELRIKYKRRQTLYNLRNLEKRGMELIASGITMENMEDVLFGDLELEEGE